MTLSHSVIMEWIKAPNPSSIATGYQQVHIFGLPDTVQHGTYTVLWRISEKTFFLNLFRHIYEHHPPMLRAPIGFIHKMTGFFVLRICSRLLKTPKLYVLKRKLHGIPYGFFNHCDRKNFFYFHTCKQVQWFSLLVIIPVNDNHHLSLITKNFESSWFL